MNALFKYVSLSLLIAVNSYVLPVEKCRLEDSKCLLASVQKAVPIFFGGVPELGIEKVDSLDDISFDLSGLKLSLKNAKVKDLRDTIIDSVKCDTKTQKIFIDFHVDSTMKGDYIASGKILILPIEGDGKLKIKLKNIAVKLSLDYDVEKHADGKDYIRPQKYTFEYDVKDHAEYQLTNLFKGNKELSETLLHFMNENWKDVSREFGRPLLENLAKKIYKTVKIFFEKSSINDIAIV